ncbi:MAG TPA: 3-oxoacyl-ACP reductase FabG [Firmicutes bacterium]|nr:3-oxoacyl-ACP reductase FabG [Bacillota bacterium]
MGAKTVLITGASRGIGRAAAELFAARGYRVMLNYLRSRDEAEALEQELTARGADAMAYRADVSDRDQVWAMADACRRRFGGVDVLVCNAGIARQGLFTDLTPEAWREMLGVHLDGAFHCCQAVLPGMIRRQAGSIVLVSSIWGLVGASCEAAYSAAKAGVIGLAKALAKEVGPSGIRVNCVAPGVVDTAMNASLDAAALAALREETPLGRLGTPEEIARAIVFLASEEAGFITGQVLSPNGGFVI